MPKNEARADAGWNPRNEPGPVEAVAAIVVTYFPDAAVLERLESVASRIRAFGGR